MRTASEELISVIEDFPRLENIRTRKKIRGTHGEETKRIGGRMYKNGQIDKSWSEELCERIKGKIFYEFYINRLKV